jgi:2-keto-3-deoxy-L-arabinonate dehydratase
MAQKVYRGVFPVALTVFDELGRLDIDGRERAIDFMIDVGSNGICILANFSEQFLLSDLEKTIVQDAYLNMSLVEFLQS